MRYVVVRLAPKSAGLNVLGMTHYDQGRAERVVAALGARVASVTRHGDAVLVQLA